MTKGYKCDGCGEFVKESYLDISVEEKSLRGISVAGRYPGEDEAGVNRWLNANYCLECVFEDGEAIYWEGSGVRLMVEPKPAKWSDTDE